jgi:hypothetical protein
MIRKEQEMNNSGVSQWRDRLLYLVLVAIAIALPVLPIPLAARMVNDPQSPISLDVPNGWNMRSQHGVSSIDDGRNGSAYWFKVPGGGRDSQRIYSTFDQIFKQYREPRKLAEKQVALSGSPGIFVVVGGFSPNGVEVITKAIAAPFGDDAWVLVLSGPVDRFQALQPTLEDIAASFRVGAGAGAAGGVAPSPGSPIPPVPGMGKQAMVGANGLPPKTWRLEPSIIADPYGQEQPVTAATLFIPQGWRTRGGVQWAREYGCTFGFATSWSAVSPDGQSSIRVLPHDGWDYNDAPNPNAVRASCRKSNVRELRPYLQTVIARTWPGATLSGYRPRTDTVAAPKTAPSPSGGVVKSWEEAAEVYFEFPSAGGPMRGILMGKMGTEMHQFAVSSSEEKHFAAVYVHPIIVMTAPAAQADRGLLEAVRTSIQPDPQWLQVLQGHAGRIMTDAIKQAGKRADIWEATNNEISALRKQAWENSQQSVDRRAIAFSQTIRGVENYTGPDGRKTELSSGYSAAWKLNDGTYLMSTNPAFDARRDLGVSAERLDPNRQ